MSRSPEVKEDTMECPLCMEPLEIDDVNFFPCTCGYQICRFCWHRIRTDENGLCPACRKPYPEDPAVYKPLSQEELQRIKNEKKQKQSERKQKITENRKHLSSVRVVQRNLVFVVGLSQRLADPEVLKRLEYFGKFGKIHKVVINNSTSYAGSQGPSASAYVTYIRSEDALRAIQCVNNVVVDGRTLKASLGTTKYCSYFLKSMQCPKSDCMYLHELGDEAASFTKEEMQAGKHQEYEQKLLQELYKTNPNFLQSSTGEKTKGKSGTSQSSNSNNKESWPSLQTTGKTPNGLPEHHKTPPLDGGSDSENMTPDGPYTELGLSSITGLPPFTSNWDSVVPICVAGLTVRSPFEGAAAESQSLFSDNSNFRHPNPIPSGLSGFSSSLHSNSDWPTAPEPQSLFTSDTIPVSSSTDWQAAFGFGSSAKQQDDDLGFDPFDVTRKALADLIEKELSVQDKASLPMTGRKSVPVFPHGPLLSPLHNAPSMKGPLQPPTSSHFAPNSSLPSRGFSQLPHRTVYNSFSFPGQAQTSRHSWMGMPMRNNLPHLNHTGAPSSAAQHSSFLDLNLAPQQQHHHSTRFRGIHMTENSTSVESLNVKEWQDGLRALLPNININFGGLPSSSSSSPSSSSSSSSVNHTGGISHSLSWDGTASWMDPAIITGIPASSGNSLDSLQDDNPPHWLNSLQALTEMDVPTGSTVPPQPRHSGPFGAQFPHRAGWTPYPTTVTANPATQFHSPPPGFQTAFRASAQASTDLLQSAGMDRH
uniref:CCR4-NOT transcription complex subunit 4 n=1 Tax=Sinocyclocheilus grahami TaxID=75366 RepID=A0A672K3C2_SINGR